MGAKKAVFFCY